ncbi:MAG: hypothetical protein ABFD84_12995 [Candidatus Polarisedimenticolia bacterium]|nr:hypothetical protein [bacterium]
MALALACSAGFHGCASGPRDQMSSLDALCGYDSVKLKVVVSGPRIAATVSNGSRCSVFLIPENDGVVWWDGAHRALYVDQSAYSWRRENRLRGGWTSRADDPLDFQELPRGQRRTLVFTAGPEAGCGAWNVIVRIPVFKSADSLRNKPRSRVGDWLSGHEFVLSSLMDGVAF